MSNSRICRYYLQGNCTYGSSCRFSHSNNRHYDEYQPKTNRNERNKYQDNENLNNKHNDRGSSRNSDQYEQSKYRHGNERNLYQDHENRNIKHNNRESYRSSDQYEKNNYRHGGNGRNRYQDNENWNNKHNNRESYRNSDQYEQNNYQQGSKSNVKNNYNNKNDYKDYNSYENKNGHQSHNKTDYRDFSDYENKNRRQSHKDYNTNNYSKEYNKGNIFNENYSYSNRKYNDDHRKAKYDKDLKNFSFNVADNDDFNSHINSDDQLHNKYKYKKGNICINERNKMIQFYEKEIKSYQTQLIQMQMNKSWPFTCFHPIGYNHPIQSVGSLNLIEISFEEIRCDFYAIKNVCADPDLIHKQVFSELLSKANQQKEEIISLSDKIVDDMLITFNKCEQLKTNPDFKDSIQADENSYWNMSLKRLEMSNENKELEAFSFKTPFENTNFIDNTPKILMQTEVYGKTDKGFDQENFTDYIPIMPPPKMYCL